MSKNEKNGKEAQGAPTEEQVTSWLTGDFEKLAALINMIRNDPEALKWLAHQIHSRIEESREEELRKTKAAVTTPHLFEQNGR